MRASLTKKLGRRWRGSGGICHSCTPWDLAPSCPLVPVPGPHNVPTAQPQRRPPKGDERRRCRGRFPCPGNSRPSNHAKYVSCHPASHATRLAQLGPNRGGGSEASTTRVPGPRAQIFCWVQIQILEPRCILDGRAQAHTSCHTRHKTAQCVTTVFMYCIQAVCLSVCLSASAYPLHDWP